MFKACCFSGHREIANNDLLNVKHRVERLVVRLIELGCRDFYNGGARGFDLLCAEIVLYFKKDDNIKLHMALPCKTQTRGWCAGDKKRHEYVLKRADDIYYASEVYTPSCMHIRNQYMVDMSDVCICYLKHAQGGTYNTIAYAKKEGIEVVNLAQSL